MFSKIKSFVLRHKRKLVVTGVVIGGAIFLSRYVRKAISDLQQKDTKDYLDRTRRQQHYESVQRTCNNTALNLTSKVTETIGRLCDTEALITSLQKGNCNKFQTWEELKYLAFSRLTLLIFVTSTLMVTLRLQLSLIGGYMFKRSILENKVAENDLLNEKYLALTKHFLDEGTTKINMLVQEKVKIILKDRRLKEKLGIQDISQIFWAIQSALCEDPRSPCNNLPELIIPENIPDELSGEEKEIYHRIISETRELLESDEIIHLCRSSISRGFSIFVDKIAEYFIDRDGSTNIAKPNSTSSSQRPDEFFAANIPECDQGVVSYLTIPMARIIPIVSGLARGSAVTDVSHTWMQQLVLTDDLKVLGANIYEAFSV